MRISLPRAAPRTARVPPARCRNRSSASRHGRARTRCRSAWSRRRPAPRRRAPPPANDVAIEKKITVPPSAVARIAPCSQPGTSTQTTVTSAGPPSACGDRRRQRDRIAGVGERDLVGQPGRAQRSRSASTGTTPTVRAAPARRAAASDSEPLLPAPPSTATVTLVRRPYAARTTRSVSAGAPHTSSTARASSRSRSSGSTAAIERANRIACPARGTCSLRPSQPAQPVGDRQRRQGQRDQRGDPVAGLEPQRRLGPDRLDGADQHAAGAGDRIVHLAAGTDDLQDLGADRRAVAAVLLRQLPEAGRVEVEPLDRDPHLVGADLRIAGPAARPPAAAHRPVRAPGADRPVTSRTSPVSRTCCRHRLA